MKILLFNRICNGVYEDLNLCKRKRLNYYFLFCFLGRIIFEKKNLLVYVLFKVFVGLNLFLGEYKDILFR